MVNRKTEIKFYDKYLCADETNNAENKYSIRMPIFGLSSAVRPVQPWRRSVHQLTRININ